MSQENIIQQIKEKLDIMQLAEEAGCKPYGRGKARNTKHNPFRTENHSSLKIYPDSQSFSDFGDKSIGGDALEFYRLMHGLTMGDAISELKAKFDLDNDYEVVTVPNKEYLKPEIVDKIFNQQHEIDFKNKDHLKELYEIAPKWCFDSAREVDTERFFNLVRYSQHYNTAVALLKDEHNVSRTMRYRRKEVGERLAKWVSLPDSQASVPYCNFFENDKIGLCVEGSRDYITAVLMGYTVIALPHAQYKIPNELLSGRTWVFIDDDDDKNSMAELVEDAICDKKVFNHKEFKKITKCESKDFSDYLYQFEDLETFKSAFDGFINELPSENTSDWKSKLDKKGLFVTQEILDEVANMRMLIDGTLAAGQITTIVGQPNVGKSAFVYGVINMLMNNGKIDYVVYFDADNPLIYAKDRVSTLLSMYGDRFKYYSGTTATKEQMMEILQELALHSDGENVLVIIDSLKNFISGSISGDDNVNIIFDKLQAVRDKFKPTIITLHHTKKGKDDDNNLEYVGSQVIEASSDNMSYIEKDSNGALLLRNKKARSLLIPIQEINVDFENMGLTIGKELNDDEYNERKAGNESEKKPIEVDEDDVIAYFKEHIECNLKEVQKIFKGYEFKDNKSFKMFKKGDVWFVRHLSKDPIVVDFVGDF